LRESGRKIHSNPPELNVDRCTQRSYRRDRRQKKVGFYEEMKGTPEPKVDRNEIKTQPHKHGLNTFNQHKAKNSEKSERSRTERMLEHQNDCDACKQQGSGY